VGRQDDGLLFVSGFGMDFHEFREFRKFPFLEIPREFLFLEIFRNFGFPVFPVLLFFQLF